MKDTVVDGAMIKCSQGAAPGKLKIIRMSTKGCSSGVGNIGDMKPGVNLPPTFGACMATPTCPCSPTPVGPWSSSSKVKVDKLPVLDKGSKLQCVRGGSIQILYAGQGSIQNG
jgi:hypothetical protein